MVRQRHSVLKIHFQNDSYIVNYTTVDIGTDRYIQRGKGLLFQTVAPGIYLDALSPVMILPIETFKRVRRNFEFPSLEPYRFQRIENRALEDLPFLENNEFAAAFV